MVERAHTIRRHLRGCKYLPVSVVSIPGCTAKETIPSEPCLWDNSRGKQSFTGGRDQRLLQIRRARDPNTWVWEDVLITRDLWSGDDRAPAFSAGWDTWDLNSELISGNYCVFLPRTFTLNCSHTHPMWGMPQVGTSHTPIWSSSVSLKHWYRIDSYIRVIEKDMKFHLLEQKSYGNC